MQTAVVNVWAVTLLGVVNMKTKKISYCGISAALVTAIMLVAHIPFLTYAIPCIASVIIMGVVIELGVKYALATYFTSLLPVFLFCEPESKLLYICLMGFYPVLKAVFEKIPSRILEYVLKFAVANAAFFAVYYVSTFVMNIPLDDMGEFGKYSALILLGAANVTFLLYDICIGKLSFSYMILIHPTVKKMLK